MDCKLSYNSHGVVIQFGQAFISGVLDIYIRNQLNDRLKTSIMYDHPKKLRKQD